MVDRLGAAGKPSVARFFERGMKIKVYFGDCGMEEQCFQITGTCYVIERRGLVTINLSACLSLP